jgi:5'-3' exonuclease
LSLNRADFEDRYGVRPEQFADYLALVGDPVDDIPGVPGVGPKTAAALLQAFGDLRGLRDSMAQVAGLPIRGAAALADRLESHWSQLTLSRELTALETQIPGLDRAPRFDFSVARLENLASFLRELGLRGPLTQRCESLARSLAA